MGYEDHIESLKRILSDSGYPMYISDFARILHHYTKDNNIENDLDLKSFLESILCDLDFNMGKEHVLRVFEEKVKNFFSLFNSFDGEEIDFLMMERDHLEKELESLKELYESNNDPEILNQIKQIESSLEVINNKIAYLENKQIVKLLKKRKKNNKKKDNGKKIEIKRTVEVKGYSLKDMRNDIESLKRELESIKAKLDSLETSPKPNVDSKEVEELKKEIMSLKREMINLFEVLSKREYYTPLPPPPPPNEYERRRKRKKKGIPRWVKYVFYAMIGIASLPFFIFFVYLMILAFPLIAIFVLPMIILYFVLRKVFKKLEGDSE